MPYTNTGLEIADGSTGYPQDWIFNAFVSVERIALFGTAMPLIDVESFEAEWIVGDYLFEFDPLVDLVAPIFDDAIGAGETYEDFEEGWSLNHGYSFEMGSTEAATFDALLTPESIEDFEEGWSSNHLYDFAMGSTTAAMFDTGSEAVEDFEEGWFSGAYQTVMGATTTAMFDAGGQAVEDFEGVFGPIVPSTIDYGTSTFTYVGHGLTNTNVVRVRPSEGGGLMPIPLQEDTNYYIVGSTANTFQLSGTSGGAAIVLTAAGVGIALYRNPAFYWPADGPT